MPLRAKQHGASKQQKRLTANQRGYGYKWQVASKAYLRDNPLCRPCKARGKVKLATCVDHIKPHKGNQVLFWDRNNWQPSCARCNNEKRAKQEGGFGR